MRGYIKCGTPGVVKCWIGEIWLVIRLLSLTWWNGVSVSKVGYQGIEKGAPLSSRLTGYWKTSKVPIQRPMLEISIMKFFHEFPPLETQLSLAMPLFGFLHFAARVRLSSRRIRIQLRDNPAPGWHFSDHVSLPSRHLARRFPFIYLRRDDRLDNFSAELLA